MHEHHAAAHVARERHLMRHDEHRHALAGQILHDGKHFADHFGVERARRLVEQEDLGIHGQCAGDGHALLLAAGDLARLGVDIGRHTDLFEVMHGLFARLSLFAAKHLDLADHAVIEHSHIVEQIERLEDHADVRTVFRRVDAAVGDVFAVIEDLAARRRLQKVYAAQKR